MWWRWWWRRGLGVCQALYRSSGHGRGGMWTGMAGGGGSLLLLWAAHAAQSSPVACLTDPGIDTDLEEDLDLSQASPLEMNEIAALTHSSLLRQASGVTVDASLQLLHRTLRATLDLSRQYRKQLHQAIDLMEYCTTVLRHPEEHDRVWGLLVAARSHADSLKQQLKDLDLLMGYACSLVESGAMASFITGAEFTATSAQQVTDSARLQLKNDAIETKMLEGQYIHTHTHYIEASQRALEEEEEEERKEKELEQSLSVAPDAHEGQEKKEETETEDHR